MARYRIRPTASNTRQREIAKILDMERIKIEKTEDGGVLIVDGDAFAVRHVCSTVGYFLEPIR